LIISDSKIVFASLNRIAGITHSGLTLLSAENFFVEGVEMSLSADRVLRS